MIPAWLWPSVIVAGLLVAWAAGAVGLRRLRRREHVGRHRTGDPAARAEHGFHELDCWFAGEPHPYRGCHGQARGEAVRGDR